MFLETVGVTVSKLWDYVLSESMINPPDMRGQRSKTLPNTEIPPIIYIKMSSPHVTFSRHDIGK